MAPEPGESAAGASGQEPGPAENSKISPGSSASAIVPSVDTDDLSLLLRAIQSPQFGVFEAITYLSDYASNVGVHFTLCQRLRSYPRDEVEFFLPQLIQIYTTVETESAALEDFLMELSSNNPHTMLQVFWHLQASLRDMASEPQSYSFIAAKRLYNKIQYELFAFGSAPTESIRENTAPAMVLASMVAASLVPAASISIKPLVVSQGRRQRSYLLRIANKIRGKVDEPDTDEHTAKERASSFGLHETGARSMPNLTASVSPSYEQAAHRMSGDVDKVTAKKQLKMNYFRCETQFVYSLQSIANRLVSVPRAARLSALQLELALLNHDLPAEVDIPGLLKTTVIGRQDRIVRISPTEATVLNSAEKAPYLLLVEFLRDDLSFNPDTDRNRHILATPGERRYLFDRSFQAPPSSGTETNTPMIDSVLPVGEKDIADFSLSELEDLTIDEEEGANITKASSAPDTPDPSDGVPLSQQEVEAATTLTTSPKQETPIDIDTLATQMRTANIILAQLDSVKDSKLPRADVSAIKAKIIANMQQMQGLDVLVHSGAGDRKLENDLKTAGLSTSDDPSAANLGEDWQTRRQRIRKSSPYGQYPNWDLFSVIVKTGDDLRQEALASQMIQKAQSIWKEAGVDVWVKKMGILITGSNSGLVETITNGLSIHSIKKALTASNTSKLDASASSAEAPVAELSQHFEAKFGPPEGRRYQQALHNFVKSLASYSLLVYLMQIKDRHNGNILLDNDGHIIHIDFGFMLSNAPGGRFGFENAPFKLTQEYVDLIGGTESKLYAKFVSLMKEAFKKLREHADEFVRFVEIMSKDSHLPCFQNGPATATQLRQRFQLHLSDSEVDDFVEKTLIFRSYRSVYTRLYDQFQMVTQGIYS